MDTNIAAIPMEWMIVFVLLALWELTWKGMALWRAGKRDAKVWFIVILVTNTAGILPIIYLLLTKKERQ